MIHAAGANHEMHTEQVEVRPVEILRLRAEPLQEVEYYVGVRPLLRLLVEAGERRPRRVQAIDAVAPGAQVGGRDNGEAGCG